MFKRKGKKKNKINYLGHWDVLVLVDNVRLRNLNAKRKKEKRRKMSLA